MLDTSFIRKTIKQEFHPARLAKEAAWTWGTLATGIAVATALSLLLKDGGAGEGTAFLVPFLGMAAIFVASLAVRFKKEAERKPDYLIQIEHRTRGFSSRQMDTAYAELAKLKRDLILYTPADKAQNFRAWQDLVEASEAISARWRGPDAVEEIREQRGK